ncbi:MAG: XdhC family aldehyde oxidoreductase maturation factor [Peptococcales bacterium]|jgi:xanthine dehydrogenase accessory factor
MMDNIWQEMFSLLSQGESFVTGTIFSKSGSAPRTAGAKMLIRADGSIIGTIGGGKLEGEVRVLAKEIFKSKKPRLKDFTLIGQDAEDMDMICGGSGEIFLDFIDAEEKTNIEIYQEIINLMEKKKKCWLITGLPIGEKIIFNRQQCLVKEDGTLVGKFEYQQEFLEKLISGPAKISIHSEALEDLRILVEPIRNTGTVYIFGAGHISQQIAPVAQRVGFKTVVIDDRLEYASRERFPFSELILLDSFNKPLPELPIDENSYLVIVTRGHLYDKTVLAQMLRKPAAYLGMIGSKRKRNLIYQALEEEGFTREELLRVHSPIGLEILAETPEEIAVSIVAELIKVRAEREKDANQ